MKKIIGFLLALGALTGLYFRGNFSSIIVIIALSLFVLLIANLFFKKKI